jgi:cell wall assembly regulator SMI1
MLRMPITVADAERSLGVEFPVWLRTLYEKGDGRYRTDGAWWVVWPLDRLVALNDAAWRDERLSDAFLAFGDDGTGNPFCVALAGWADEVVRWSWIDGDVETVIGTMDDFERTWVAESELPSEGDGHGSHGQVPGGAT